MKSLLILAILLPAVSSFNRMLAQDSTKRYNKIFSFPDKLLGSIDHKSVAFQEKLAHQTERYLQKLAKQEKRLRRKLERKDSAAAARLFNGADSQYAALQKGFNEVNDLPQNAVRKAQHVYSSHLDSMNTALIFLDQNKLLGQSADVQSKLQSSIGQLSDVQNKLDQTAAIQQYLQQRQQYLQEQLGKFGFTSQLLKYKETIYYYRAQMDEYKKAWEDPSLLEAKAMDLLSKTQLFRDFFNKHSELAGLFRLPGSNSDPSGGALAGLQTRAMLQQDLQQRFGAGPNMQQTMQQSIGAAQSQLSQTKDKLNNLLNKGGGDAGMPNFKPNNQKTKSFLQRLEFGSNMQSTKSNYFFPVTTDLGASVGYKITDKSVAGVGMSYKVGWGKDFRNIAVSHQGLGLRSFMDVKIKGGFWLSGGGELNYRSAFKDFSELNDFTPWQKSALLGLSKKYSVGKKRKGNAQLLYDFLHKQQVPETQALVFRVGYTL